jgi:glutamate 5-kinase
MRGEWTGAKRIVVKIGSSLLVDAAAGTLRQAWLEALADDIAGLRRAGKEVVVVSSGAIALGRSSCPKARSSSRTVRRRRRSVRSISLMLMKRRSAPDRWSPRKCC